MGEQGVHQRAARMSRRRMHHKPGRLVDNDDVVVLIDDIERDLLAFRLGVGRLRHLDYDRIAVCDVISGVADLRGAYSDGAFKDQRFQPRARQGGQTRRQHAVEPGRSFIAGDGHFQPSGAHLR